MSDAPNYAQGLYFNEPHERAPDFVLGSISVKPGEFANWMKENSEAKDAKGYLRLDVKKSKNGKVYVALSTWKPDASKAETRRNEARSEPDFDDSIPF